MVSSAILCALVCWGSRLTVAHIKRLNKLICKACNVVAVKSDSLVEVTVDTGTSHAGQPQEDIHQKLRPTCGWTIFTYIILFILLYIILFNFGISNLKLCFECLSLT